MVSVSISKTRVLREDTENPIESYRLKHKLLVRFLKSNEYKKKEFSIWDKEREREKELIWYNLWPIFTVKLILTKPIFSWLSPTFTFTGWKKFCAWKLNNLFTNCVNDTFRINLCIKFYDDAIRYTKNV